MPLQDLKKIKIIYPPYSYENPTSQKQVVWRTEQTVCLEYIGL